MALITAALDLFCPKPEEMGVEESRDEIIPAAIPLPSSNCATPLEFRVCSSQDMYTDMSSVILEIDFKMMFTDGTPIGKDEHFCVLNNFLNSAFSGVSISLNGTTIVPNNNAHAWTSYLRAISEYSNHAGESFLKLAGYYPEKPADVYSFSDTSKQRSKAFFDGAIVKLAGPIMSPFFNNRKWLVPGVDIGITLFRNNTNFLCMHNPKNKLADDKKTILPGEKKTFALTIERAQLWVTRKRLNEQLHQQMMNQLTHMPAIYNFDEVMVRTIVLSKNTFNIDTNLVDGGLLPKRIDVVQLGQESVNGSLGKSALNMKRFGLTSMALEKNGQTLENYTIDTARPYLQLFRQNGRLFTEQGNVALNQANWAEGHFLIRFNLDQNPIGAGWKMKPTTGHLRLKACYDQNQESTETIVILVMMTYERGMQINGDKRVTHF